MADDPRWEEPAPPRLPGGRIKCALAGARSTSVVVLVVAVALLAGLTASLLGEQSAPGSIPVSRGGAAPPERAQRWTVTADRPAISADGPVGEVLAIGMPGGVLEAVDTHTGGRRWSFKEDTTVAFGLGGAPGTIIAVAGDESVYALDAASGRTRWAYDPRQGRTMTIPPVATDGAVFMATAYFPEGVVAAVDLATGRERWRATVPAPPYFGLTVAGPVVLAASGRGVAALDVRDGTLRWAWTGRDPAFAGSGGGIVAIAEGARLRGIDPATGVLRWSARLGARVRGEPTVLAEESSAAELVLVTGWDGAVEARDARTGTPRWACVCGALSPPAVAGGVVRIGTADGVIALDAADGSRRWEVVLGLPVRARPAAVAGVTYLTTATDIRRIDDPAA